MAAKGVRDNSGGGGGGAPFTNTTRLASIPTPDNNPLSVHNTKPSKCPQHRTH